MCIVRKPRTYTLGFLDVWFWVWFSLVCCLETWPHYITLINLEISTGWPQTQRSMYLCLPCAGIKGIAPSSCPEHLDILIKLLSLVFQGSNIWHKKQDKITLKIFLIIIFSCVCMRACMHVFVHLNVQACVWKSQRTDF